MSFLVLLLKPARVVACMLQGAFLRSTEMLGACGALRVFFLGRMIQSLPLGSVLKPVVWKYRYIWVSCTVPKER